MKDVLGYTPEECYADPDLILRTVHPDFQKEMERAREATGTFDQYEELCANHKNGKLVWLERLHISIYDDDGTLVAIEGISRDITERKEMTTALARSRKSLLSAQ